MKTIVKQTILVTTCILGILTGVVHTQEYDAAVKSRWRKLTNTGRREETDRFIKIQGVSLEEEPSIIAINQEVKTINRLDLQKTDLNVDLYECWQNADEGYFCDFEGGYEYNVTFHVDSEQRIRKVNYSKFSFLGDYVIDLEEYYDVSGNLIYLEYGGIGNEGGAFDHGEIHGTIYFQNANPIKNLSYEINMEGKRSILTSTQLQPDEFHTDLQSLQRMLTSQIALSLRQLSNTISEPHNDMRPVLRAVTQKCLQMEEFYNQFQAVFPLNSASAYPLISSDGGSRCSLNRAIANNF